jgi:tRNA-modifying protein YgfZ
MAPLSLHDFHQARGAIFTNQNGRETVASYASTENEYLSLTSRCGVIDLSFRSRICLLGADREKFLHGQVTNEILRLPPRQGTYAALVTAKGKLQCDLFVYKLPDELLLDFEPGLAPSITARLEKYIIAEEVQIVDVTPHYGLLSIQGPTSAEILQSLSLVPSLPKTALSWDKGASRGGDLYVVNNPRYGAAGYDLFVPNGDLRAVADRLAELAAWVGLEACEIARIENAIPRFGMDMDESNLAPEALGENAISYSKGCYIGQEVIARIRTYGQVAKALRLIRLPAELSALPAPGEKLFKDGKEVGYLTSGTISPRFGGKVAFGYVRKEANSLGEKLQFGSPNGGMAQIVATPGAKLD